MTSAFLRRAAAVLGIGGLAVAGAAVPAQATQSPGWQVQATIAPNNEEVQFDAVTALAPGDAWAVGSIGTVGADIVVHWNGSSWQQVAVPATVMARLGAALIAVGATSDSNVWSFDFPGRWLRFNGSSWTSGKLPGLRHGRHGVEIAAGLAVGKHGAWAFGFDSVNSKIVSYAARFNGSTWRAMTLPGPFGQYGVSAASAVSARDIWAVVMGGPAHVTNNALLHWNGRHWRSLALPPFLAGKVNLATVLALPGGDVWVAGGIPRGDGSYRGVTALWDGHTWTVTRLAADPSTQEDVISDMVPDGSGGVWAMGFTRMGCAGPMWHYTAGAWTDTGLAGCSVGAYVHGPEGLASVPGTTAVWGVGGQYDPNVPNGEAGLVLLYGSLP